MWPRRCGNCALLVGHVVLEHAAQADHQRLQELRRRLVGALDLLQAHLELPVLLRIVLDLGVTVLDVLADGRVAVHLLGDRVPHELGDEAVGEVAPHGGVGRRGDLSYSSTASRWSVMSSSMTSRSVLWSVLWSVLRCGRWRSSVALPVCCRCAASTPAPPDTV